jgi:hypothetical protein
MLFFQKRRISTSFLFLRIPYSKKNGGLSFRNRKSRCIILLVALMVVLFLLLSPKTSGKFTSACWACHPASYYHYLDILEGDSANQIPLDMEVGDNKTISIVIENGATAGIGTYSVLSSVSVTLTSQNGHFTVGSPTYDIYDMPVGRRTATWQIRGISNGYDTLSITAWGVSTHRNTQFFDSYSPSPLITVGDPSSASTPTPTLAPTATPALTTSANQITPTPTSPPTPTPTTSFSPTLTPSPTANPTSPKPTASSIPAASGSYLATPTPSSVPTLNSTLTPTQSSTPTPSVPEFPLWIALPLTLCTALSLIALKKKTKTVSTNPKENNLSQSKSK